MKRQNFQRPCVKGVTNTFCDDRNDETRIKARLPVLVQSQHLRSLQPLHVPGRCCNFSFVFLVPFLLLLVKLFVSSIDRFALVGLEPTAHI